MKPDRSLTADLLIQESSIPFYEAPDNDTPRSKPAKKGKRGVPKPPRHLRDESAWRLLARNKRRL